MSGRPIDDREFDLLMTEWFESDSRIPEPEELLASTTNRIKRARRVPGWLLPERWISPTRTRWVRAVPRPTPILIVLVALLVLAMIAAAFAGSQRHLPGPFGFATNGLIAYDTNAAIVVSTPNGLPRTLVGNIPNASAGTWSPDGTKLAFWGDGSPDSLYVVDQDGNGLRKLAGNLWISTDREPSWSPDGTSLVISTETGPDRFDERLEVFRVNGTQVGTVGGESLSLRHLFPTWSPDGQWIAFVGARYPLSDTIELWLVRPDGSEARRLSVSGQLLDGASWAPIPDRLRLVYAASSDGLQNDIYMYDVGTDREVVLSNDAADERYPAWSPDGTRVAWLVGDSVALRIASVDHSARGQTLDAAGIVGGIGWSPDGTRLYGIDSGNRAVVVITIDSSAPVARISHPNGQAPPHWQRLAP